MPNEENRMNISDYLESKAFAVLGLLPALSPTEQEKMAFVNDFEDIVKNDIVEYCAWADGNSDELLRIYSYNAWIQYHTEPWYDRNRRSYFWSTSSKENGIKRSHSGFAKNMLDTIVAVCGTPTVRLSRDAVLGREGSLTAKAALDGIAEANGLMSLYRKVQLPCTLKEGWGAYKIHWNVGLYGPEPVITYYRALNVRIHRRNNRVMGITFLDWYRGPDGQRYLVAETRVYSPTSKGTFYVDVFRDMGAGTLAEIPEGADVPFVQKRGVVYRNMPCLFAEPCSLYEDTAHDLAGKSILAGKIDLLDDLDQAISQASNAIRRSTPVQVFDMEYAERDSHGIPKLPSLFECRFVAVQGTKNALGESNSHGKPVETIQPNLNMQMYDEHIQSIERLILNGILSPATMGMDVALKDNADAQREKEKVTIFTRNHICEEEGRILSSVLNQALVAKEYLATGTITRLDWGVCVEYPAFADASYESKLQTMATVLANGGVSPTTFVEKVYGDSMPEERRQAEIDWLTKKNGPTAPEAEGDMPDGMEAMGDIAPVLPPEDEGERGPEEGD